MAGLTQPYVETSNYHVDVNPTVVIISELLRVSEDYFIGRWCPASNQYW